MFTVTAVNRGGTTQSAAKLTVLPRAPEHLRYRPLVAFQDEPVSVTPTCLGVPESYTLRGSLPEGLAFDSRTGEVAGTPLQPLTQPVVLWVTASNAGGVSARAELTVSVLPLLPRLEYQPVLLRVSEDVMFAPVRTGGWITKLSVSPALPRGLSIDAKTGGLHGRPMVRPCVRPPTGAPRLACAPRPG